MSEEKTVNKLEFEGILSKHSYKCDKGGNVYVVMGLRFTSGTGVQHFLEPLERIVGGGKIKTLFDNGSTDICWNKVSIDLKEYANRDVVVVFDENEFDASLVGINISRKMKKDTEVFQYDIILSKEVGENNWDSTFASSYLNHKEPDENGKDKIVYYPIEITME